MALKPLNSVAGFSVGETPSNVILGNGDITTNNFTTTGVANLNNISNVKIAGGSNTQVIQTDGAGNLSFVTIDTWRIQNGTSNVQVAPLNGNVTVTVSGNANIATFTSTGVNVSGYLTVEGTVAANGNLSANNYLVTPVSTDLIVAPGTQLTRIYANVNPYTDVGYSLGNALARWNNVFSNTANVTGNIAAGGLLTNNLYYANGNPWDLQEAAGSNTQIQYNDGLNNFGASANFTYNDATQLLTVNGNAQFNNANLGNLAIANFVNVASNVTSNNVSVNLELTGNTANFSGNVILPNLTVNATLNGNVANFTGNLTAANSNLGNLATANFVNVSSNLQVTDTANVGNLRTDNLLYANGAPWDLQEAAGSNTQIQYNDGSNNFGASANLTYDYANNVLTVSGGNVVAGNFIGNISGNLSAPGANTQVIFNDSNIAGAVANLTYDKTYNSNGGSLNVGNTNGGRILTDSFYASYANVNGNVDTSGNISATGNIAGNNITASGNISTTGAGGDITMSGGNITGVNDISANSANFAATVVANNITVNLNVSGNTANFTGNISAANANLGNLATANYFNAAIDINALAGNMLANGNVTANGFLNSANANVTGEVLAGSLVTANITAPSGNITISAVGVDQNIILNPSGNGTVDIGLHKVTQVGDPTNPKDAATKEYVDNIAQGLSVHTAVNVTSISNLNATYLDGGTTQTTTTISGGKTITFSANHSLSVGDEIYWTNTFNGITAYNAYFVYSTPALNQITIKDGFYGAEVTTLTNGTGLTQPSRANSGVGATLTNAGANAAIQIDGISLSSTNRVLVQGQTNAFENGVYTVTTVGNGSTQWVLTRASDENTYDPKSTTGLAYGDYFFVQQGLGYAGSSYVLTTPVGEIVFGYTNLAFSQFSAAGSYSAGSGISITGTTISANTDGVTTDIVSGNIVVKAGANLTTPNLGDASFSSLSWNNLSNGNVTANNLSIGNIANITLDLTVGGNVQANGTITSNANISAANFTTTGNVTAANITANSTVFASNANVSGTTITNALTVNNAIAGNTANFSGNVVVPNLTVNLEFSGNTANFTGTVVVPNLTVNNNIAGNTANFTGNISAANANLGNLATANFFTGTLINGTSNVAIPTTNGNVNITAGGNTSLVVTATGANVVGNLGVSGNFNVNNLQANNLSANTAVNIGNTSITWDSVTTSSVTANQTIASLNTTGITGLEFLVKAVDSAGSKYSVATVQAVTDGTSVDFATFGTVQLGGYTGSLAVNVVGGYVRLQVTPASSNSTVWTTQARTI